MLEDLHGVATTALLVNDSRARRPELSRDRFAGAWIPAARRPAVRQMWDQFAEEVYRHDDVITSVRCRAVLDVLGTVLAREPDAVLLSLGAGFTSYPWLMEIERSIEVDLPKVIDAKRYATHELTSAGVLPIRNVRQIGADLSLEESLETVRAAVAELVPPDRAIVVVIEGLLYYLQWEVCELLLGFHRTLDRRVAAAVVSYWPTASRHNRVLERQAAWFEHLAVPPTTTLLETSDVVQLLGSGTTVRGPEELQIAFGLEPAIPESEVVPEYVAEWVG